MKEKLKAVLEIQELDMKMLRLIRVKKERKKELAQIAEIRKDFMQQLQEKEAEVCSLEKSLEEQDKRLLELEERLKKLDEKQNTIKKMEEFHALTQEMASVEREKVHVNQKISDLNDQKSAEQDLLENIKESHDLSERSSKQLEAEIQEGIVLINEEGRALKEERDGLVSQADVELFQIYERLLKNKKDRVIVPVQQRTCGGCYISLTAQHENLVRKGDNLLFCEHCSRIHFWEDEGVGKTQGTGQAKRRRRKMANA